ncbi:5-fold beta-flower protein [Prochlorothrix hollandica]|uniref:5-fold beta-flower protein n=1 Tax=Prochlorothrix hollandica TaxID=1223 RepID=UPI0033409418
MTDDNMPMPDFTFEELGTGGTMETPGLDGYGLENHSLDSHGFENHSLDSHGFENHSLDSPGLDGHGLEGAHGFHDQGAPQTPMDDHPSAGGGWHDFDGGSAGPEPLEPGMEPHDVYGGSGVEHFGESTDYTSLGFDSNPEAGLVDGSHGGPGVAHLTPDLLHLNSAQSSLTTTTSDQPYVTVNQSGSVYSHASSSSENWVGTVHGNSFENKQGNDLGHVSNGTVYDHWDHVIGSVHGGHIFNAKGVQIGTASNDIEGAAYLFFIVKGGVQ